MTDSTPSSVNTEVTPVSPVATPSPQPSQNYWKLLAFILLILLLASGATAFYFWQQSTGHEPSVAVQTPVPSATPVDETAEWQTYTNTKQQYSLKYPSDYSVSAEVYNPDPTDTEALLIQAGEAQFEKPAFRVQVDTVRQENAYKNKPYSSLKQLADYLVEDAKTSQGIKGTITKPLTKTTFAGREAYTYSYRGIGYEGFATSGIGYTGAYTVIVTSDDANYFLITYNDAEAFSQIAGTFQFMSHGTSITTTSKTYDNRNAGISFKTPTSWNELLQTEGVVSGPMEANPTLVVTFADKSTIKKGTDAPFDGFSVHEQFPENLKMSPFSFERYLEQERIDVVQSPRGEPNAVFKTVKLGNHTFSFIDAESNIRRYFILSPDKQRIVVFSTATRSPEFIKQIEGVLSSLNFVN